MTNASPWRIRAPEALALRDWDDEVVVYNDATGHTHHLDRLGGGVLLALMRNPAGFDVPQLIEQIPDTVGIREPEVLALRVQETLEQLARLDLVVRDTA